MRASSISRRRGGNTLNSLEVLQQLLEHRSGVAIQQASLPLYAVAVLPARSSAAVKEISESLAIGPKTSLEHCIYREEYTEPASSYIIKSLSSGTRTIVNYNQLPEMTVEEFVQIADGLPTGPKWFHFEVSQGVDANPSFILIRLDTRRCSHPMVCYCYITYVLTRPLGPYTGRHFAMHTAHSSNVPFPQGQCGGRKTRPPTFAGTRCRGRCGLLFEKLGPGNAMTLPCFDRLTKKGKFSLHSLFLLHSRQRGINPSRTFYTHNRP